MFSFEVLAEPFLFLMLLFLLVPDLKDLSVTASMSPLNFPLCKYFIFGLSLITSKAKRFHLGKLLF